MTAWHRLLSEYWCIYMFCGTYSFLQFRFLLREQDISYGVKDHNTELMWFVYGYPKPKMTYYFDDMLIESGGRFDQSYTRNGQATLFINKWVLKDYFWVK